MECLSMLTSAWPGYICRLHWEGRHTDRGARVAAVGAVAASRGAVAAVALLVQPRPLEGPARSQQDPTAS